MFPVSLSHLSLLSLSSSPNFCRVFGDRLNDDKDREQFNTMLSEKLGTHMDVTFHSICQNRILPTFDDFVNQNQNYEDLVDSDKLKVHMQKVVKDYKETPRHGANGARSSATTAWSGSKSPRTTVTMISVMDLKRLYTQASVSNRKPISTSLSVSVRSAKCFGRFALLSSHDHSSLLPVEIASVCTHRWSIAPPSICSAIGHRIPCRAPDGLGLAQPGPARPGPAQPSPAHGLFFVRKRNHGMGWAFVLFDGLPWAESCSPWLKKYFLC